MFGKTFDTIWDRFSNGPPVKRKYFALWIAAIIVGAGSILTLQRMTSAARIALVESKHASDMHTLTVERNQYKTALADAERKLKDYEDCPKHINTCASEVDDFDEWARFVLTEMKLVLQSIRPNRPSEATPLLKRVNEMITDALNQCRERRQKSQCNHQEPPAPTRP